MGMDSQEVPVPVSANDLVVVIYALARRAV